MARLGLRQEPRTRCRRRRDASAATAHPPKFSSPTRCRPPPCRSSRIAASRSISSPSSATTRTSSPRSIGDFDGLAIRSATKVTPKILEKAKQPQGDRPRRHRRRQRRHSGGDRQGHHRDEHAVRQFDHHRRARHHADAGAGAADPAGRRLDPGRQVGEEPLHGRRDHRQDARRHRLRQYRLDRRRPRAWAAHEGDRLRSVPVAGARAAISASRRSSSTSCSGAPISSRCTRRSPRRPGTSSTPRRSRR